MRKASDYPTCAEYLEATGWNFMDYCGMWLDPQDDMEHKPPYGLYYEADAIELQQRRDQSGVAV